MAAETHQNPVYDGELDDKKPGYETAVEGGYANYGPHTPGAHPALEDASPRGSNLGCRHTRQI